MKIKVFKILKCSSGEGWSRTIIRISEKSKKVLQIMKKERNFLQTIKRRNADCIGNILRWTCRLNHIIIEGKIEGMIGVMGRRQRIRKHLLDDLK
jgi:hypothetical protein